MNESFLLPDVDDLIGAPFWAGCARGELLVQRFRVSGNVVFPPRPMDPLTRSLDYEWVPAAGTGTIWSFVVAHPPLLPAYAELAPYPVVVVQLDDHPSVRMVGNLVAAPDAPINSVDPASIEIAAPVHVAFTNVGEVTLPRWIPQPGATTSEK